MNAANHGLVDKIGEDLGSMFGGDQASASVEVIMTLSDAQQLIVKDAYYHSLKSVWIMVSFLALLNDWLISLIAAVRGSCRRVVHRQFLSTRAPFE